MPFDEATFIYAWSVLAIGGAAFIAFGLILQRRQAPLAKLLTNTGMWNSDSWASSIGREFQEERDISRNRYARVYSILTDMRILSWNALWLGGFYTLLAYFVFVIFGYVLFVTLIAVSEFLAFVRASDAIESYLWVRRGLEATPRSFNRGDWHFLYQVLQRISRGKWFYFALGSFFILVFLSDSIGSGSLAPWVQHAMSPPGSKLVPVEDIRVLLLVCLVLVPLVLSHLLWSNEMLTLDGVSAHELQLMGGEFVSGHHRNDELKRSYESIFGPLPSERTQAY